MGEVLPHIVLAIGGVGLFLLGMTILTEGLHGLAGDMLRRVLRRFTKSPVSGAATGAVVTAIVQSSSATTVAAVGFVGAGLMTFPQALGIIFGANIGTTMTGWIVAILGFKLQLGQVVLPLVLGGALMRMFGKGRLRHAGTALAGFSLLFVGIDAMQQGMAPFQGAVTPDSFPQDTFVGRLQLLLVGVAITMITQSSSAGVVTALVALGAGALSFPQAAAMVIGMDVGTTFTTALATIGGSTATKRTGYAHVVYNCLTAVMAFALLTPFAWAAGTWFDLTNAGDAQVALVAFHSSFNALGVILIIGFTTPFAQFMIHLVPEKGALLSERLDTRLLADPAAAVDAVAATIKDIMADISRVIVDFFDPTDGTVSAARLAAVGTAIDETQSYADQIKTDASQESAHRRHLAALHALDHLDRLHERCGQYDRIATIRQDDRLKNLSHRLSAVLAAPTGAADPSLAFDDHLDQLRKDFRDERKQYRKATIDAASTGALDPSRAELQLDSVRWLHRVAYHLYRIARHLERATTQAPAELARRELITEEELD